MQLVHLLLQSIAFIRLDATGEFVANGVVLRRVSSEWYVLVDVALHSLVFIWSCGVAVESLPDGGHWCTCCCNPLHLYKVWCYSRVCSRRY